MKRDIYKKWIGVIVLLILFYLICSTTKTHTSNFTVTPTNSHLKLMKNNRDTLNSVKPIHDYVLPELFQPNTFITPSETNYIINKARPHMKRSTLLSKKLISDRDRISKTYWMSKDDPVVIKL